MKLIDILLAADFKFPEGAAVVVQDYNGFTCAASNNSVRLDVNCTEGTWWRDCDENTTWVYSEHWPVADDFATAIITREQYLQAVEAKRGAVDAGPVSADAAPIPYPSLSLYGDRRDVLTKALAFFVKWDQHALEAETMLGNDSSSYQQRITTAQDMLRELGVHHADPL